MRKLILSSCLLISLIFVGCNKQAESKALPPLVEAQFMSADKEIGKMLDELENRDIPLQRKQEILCNTYPDVYKKQYMPALLKLSPNDYNEQTLTRDFEAVIKFYNQAWSIKCI